MDAAALRHNLRASQKSLVRRNLLNSHPPVNPLLTLPIIAVVTVLVTFVMNLGSAIGISMAAAILNNGLQSCLLQTMTPDLVVPILQSSTFIRSGALTPEQVDITVKCYVSSFRIMWIAMAGMCCVAFISALFLKQHSLMSDQQQAGQDQKEGEVLAQETDSVDIEKGQLENEDADTAIGKDA